MIRQMGSTHTDVDTDTHHALPFVCCIPGLVRDDGRVLELMDPTIIMGRGPWLALQDAFTWAICLHGASQNIFRGRLL